MVVEGSSSLQDACSCWQAPNRPQQLYLISVKSVMALALKYSCFSWLQKTKWRKLVSLLTDNDSTSTLGVCLRMDTSLMPGQVVQRTGITRETL